MLRLLTIVVSTRKFRMGDAVMVGVGNQGVVMILHERANSLDQNQSINQSIQPMARFYTSLAKNPRLRKNHDCPVLLSSIFDSQEPPHSLATHARARNVHPKRKRIVSRHSSIEAASRPASASHCPMSTARTARSKGLGLLK